MLTYSCFGPTNISKTRSLVAGVGGVGMYVWTDSTYISTTFLTDELYLESGSGTGIEETCIYRTLWHVEAGVYGSSL